MHTLGNKRWWEPYLWLLPSFLLMAVFRTLSFAMFLQHQFYIKSLESTNNVQNLLFGKEIN